MSTDPRKPRYGPLHIAAPPRICRRILSLGGPLRIHAFTLWTVIIARCRLVYMGNSGLPGWAWLADISTVLILLPNALFRIPSSPVESAFTERATWRVTGQTVIWNSWDGWTSR